MSGISGNTLPISHAPERYRFTTVRNLDVQIVSFSAVTGDDTSLILVDPGIKIEMAHTILASDPAATVCHV